jgi:hypothetical protein
MQSFDRFLLESIMRGIAASILVLGALALGACTPPAAKKDAPAVAASTCPDDGPRFAGTGLCIGRSINYMDMPEAGLDLPEGCSWTPGEVMLPGDEAILYLGAECKGVKTELEFAGGARSAELKVVKSGLYDKITDDHVAARIFTLDGGDSGKDKKAVLLDMARQSTDDKKEAAACEVRPLDAAKPDGALVIDVSEAFAKANQKKYSEVYSACGPYGLTDAQRFWIIKQGYGFFFDLGQDTPDVIPQSITVMKKGADGVYFRAE